MALQNSGQISLNDLHVEAGGTTGTQASMNDTDIRALIGKASGATMSFSEWYGASAGWSSTLTVGSTSAGKNTFYGYLEGSTGSMSDDTIDTFSNNKIEDFMWQSGANNLLLRFAGSIPSSVWDNIGVNGTTFDRTDASVSYNSSENRTEYVWTSITTNPFGTTTGATRTITFTPS